MSTRVYGASDDLIEFEGDVSGEVSCFGTDDQEKGVLIIFSDGTLVEIKYGKVDSAIWGINIIKRGELFDHLEPCDDEEAKINSDILELKDGIKWAYAAREWGKVK
jgi:hypothetical protein